MRLLQFDSFYPAYLKDFYRRNPDYHGISFRDLNRRFIEDRFDGPHVLEPVLQFAPEALFVISSDPISQRKWASEHGLRSANLRDILLTQIEEHRADVVYGMDNFRFGGPFIRQLPGCVRKKLCWHATFMNGVDFQGFDLCLTSHPTYVNAWQNQGVRTVFFTPSHDPVMTEYAANEERPVDLSFAGAFSKYHKRRRELLLELAELSSSVNLRLALLHPRFRPWLDVRVLHRIPSPFPYLPKGLREIAEGPVFGSRFYRLLGDSKIALNIAGDLAEGYCGNMRCFEAMGCGACMLSDKGIYPEGMVEGETFVAYDGPQDALDKVKTILREPEHARAIGRKAAAMVAARYSKSSQWQQFQALAAL